MVTFSRRMAWLGTSVTEPNAAECTNAGFVLSPQVARISIWKPARIELGFRNRIVAALAGVAPSGPHAASVATASMTKQLRAMRRTVMRPLIAAFADDSGAFGLGVAESARD